MGKRFLSFVLVLCLMLSGCSWMDGNYVSIKHHKNDQSAGQDAAEGISDYTELLAAIFQMVENGTERGVLSVGNYEREILEQDMHRAVRYIQDQTPLGNYAVEKITYEIGARVGLTGIALEIAYRHGRGEIRQIRECFTMDSAKELIKAALRECSSGVVIKVLDYEEADIAQFVQDFVNDNPSQVMEAPQVIANTYPEVGDKRILEIQFFYETSRDQLKSMQNYVQSVFSAARLYVMGESGQSLKYAQLFTFLMNRYDYKLETALTPAYSLLRHGVGDSKAFATVYAEMCRNSGLHGFLVAGTRDGEKHYWNIVSIEGQFYHVDLLSSKEAGELQMRTTEQMGRYVWDYSFYPDCTLKEPPPEVSTEPAPTEEPAAE